MEYNQLSSADFELGLRLQSREWDNRWWFTARWLEITDPRIPSRAGQIDTYATSVDDRVMLEMYKHFQQYSEVDTRASKAKSV
ncbi:hypothetical protein EMCG_00357 [[Emmonsia] crescens]|uniref:Uncharacterized protein n=1 Tax=[Emmonsia] crescens TaxID=73230 RepID=A0A0G2J0V8_9EURO|nr:hypothetical protein EMCG_00357 [Emmonsia crescens UAMH 3008]